MRGRDPIALAGQVVVYYVANLSLVIDDQNMTVVAHFGPICLPVQRVRLRQAPVTGGCATREEAHHTYSYKFLHKTHRADIIGLHLRNSFGAIQIGPRADRASIGRFSWPILIGRS